MTAFASVRPGGMVTLPRLPCYKLGVRFGRDDFSKRFLESGRMGFYLAVLREGKIGAGAQVELLSRAAEGFTVADLTRLFVRERGNAVEPAPGCQRCGPA